MTISDSMALVCVGWCFEPSQPQRIISGLTGWQTNTSRRQVSHCHFRYCPFLSSVCSVQFVAITFAIISLMSTTFRSQYLNATIINCEDTRVDSMHAHDAFLIYSKWAWNETSLGRTHRLDQSMHLRRKKEKRKKKKEHRFALTN